MDRAPAAGKFFILRSSFLIHEGKDKGSFPADQIKTTAGKWKCVNETSELC